MFEELGLNVARQPDNGSGPRPDSRSDWLEGTSPRIPMEALTDRREEARRCRPRPEVAAGDSLLGAFGGPGYGMGFDQRDHRVERLLQRLGSLGDVREHQPAL